MENVAIRKELWRAVGWVAGLGTVCVLLLGLGLLTISVRPSHGSFGERHPIAIIVIGSVLSSLVATVLLITMSRWVRILPGLLALAALNGLLMLSSGHLVNTPSKPISRLEALLITIMCLMGAALSSTFRNRNLNAVDKITLLAFVASMALAMLNDSSASVWMAVAVCFLFLAWLYDRIQRRRPPHSESSGRDHFTASQ